MHDCASFIATIKGSAKRQRKPRAPVLKAGDRAMLCTHTPVTITSKEGKVIRYTYDATGEAGWTMNRADLTKVG